MSSDTSNEPRTLAGKAGSVHWAAGEWTSTGQGSHIATDIIPIVN
jgi:hypothetical protein